jgi:recombinational DNA repair protein RecR
MLKTLEEIKENPHDFKWCKVCNCFNAEENSRCHACGSTDFEFELEEIIQEEADFHAYNYNNEPEEVHVTVS